MSAHPLSDQPGQEDVDATTLDLAVMNQLCAMEWRSKEDVHASFLYLNACFGTLLRTTIQSWPSVVYQ